MRPFNPQQGYQPRPQQTEVKPQWEAAIEKLAGATSARFEKMEAKIDQVVAVNKNLEFQIGQIANAVNARDKGKLPSMPEINPKEHCNAITLRSGRQLGKDDEVKEVQEEEFVMIEKDDDLKERDSEVVQEQLKKESESKKEPAPYVPPIPFPQRLKRNKDDNQFQKFVQMLKQLHINIPFVDALTQIPSYAKFLKEIMSKKRKLEDFETIPLTEETSALIQNKLPPKLKDPGSFSIPCTIGGIEFSKALCDLGASVSLMPLSVARKLGLKKIQSTNVMLQLADRTITYPVGILENVIIKVKQLYIPTDLVILEMEEDVDIPIILGRPFLATAGALIDVKNGKLKFNVGEEEVEFNVFNSCTHSSTDQVFRVDVVDNLTVKQSCLENIQEPIENCLVNAGKEIAKGAIKLEGPQVYTSYKKRGKSKRSKLCWVEKNVIKREFHAPCQSKD